MLPEEVQLHIFAFVPLDQVLESLPLVCRNWHQLTTDDSLWRALYTRHFGGTSPPQSII
jgi:hypothetical protein